MRNYEVMYIIEPGLESSKTKTINENLIGVFKQFKGSIIEKKEIGLKDLAYPIQKHTKGFYFWFRVSTPIEGINEFKRLISINEKIIRYLIVREDV